MKTTKQLELIGRIAINSQGQIGLIHDREWWGWTGRQLFNGEPWKAYIRPVVIDEADADRLTKSAALRVAIRQLHDATWWTPQSIDAERANRLWSLVRELAGIPEPEELGAA